MRLYVGHIEGALVILLAQNNAVQCVLLFGYGSELVPSPKINPKVRKSLVKLTAGHLETVIAKCARRRWGSFRTDLKYSFLQNPAVFVKAYVSHAKVEMSSG